MQKRGAVLWILCAQYFVLEQVTRLGWTLPYSMGANYISDLGALHCAGAVCSPWHALMNASFVLQGALISGGAFFLHRSFPASWGFRVALALLFLAGPGVALVGVFPEDSVRAVHYAAAAEHFVTSNLGLVLLGLALLGRGVGARGFALVTLGAGLLGSTATLLFSQQVFLGLGVGGMERASIYPFTGWLVLAGLLKLGRD